MHSSSSESLYRRQCLLQMWRLPVIEQNFAYALAFGLGIPVIAKASRYKHNFVPKLLNLIFEKLVFKNLSKERLLQTIVKRTAYF